MGIQRVGHDWAWACMRASVMYNLLIPPTARLFPPGFPHVCPLPLCLSFWFTNKIIYTIFLGRGVDGPRVCHRVWSQKDKHHVIMHICELMLLHTQLPTNHQNHDSSISASSWFQRLYLRGSRFALRAVLQWVQEKSPSLSSLFSLVSRVRKATFKLLICHSCNQKS